MALEDIDMIHRKSGESKALVRYKAYKNSELHRAQQIEQDQNLTDYTERVERSGSRQRR